jgi:hypothetical protein
MFSTVRSDSRFLRCWKESGGNIPGTWPRGAAGAGAPTPDMALAAHLVSGLRAENCPRAKLGVNESNTRAATRAPSPAPPLLCRGGALVGTADSGLLFALLAAWFALGAALSRLLRHCSGTSQPRSWGPSISHGGGQPSLLVRLLVACLRHSLPKPSSRSPSPPPVAGLVYACCWQRTKARALTT